MTAAFRLPGSILLLYFCAQIAVIGCWLLNYGFIQIKIPNVARGVPLYYLLMLTGLLILLKHQIWNSPLFKTLTGRIFLTWLGYNAALILVGCSRDPFWSLRDASYVLDSAWLLIGYKLGRFDALANRTAAWPRIASVSMFGVVSAYLFRWQIVDIVPKLQGAQGQAIPMFLTAGNSAFMLLTLGAFYWGLDVRREKHRLWAYLFPPVALVLAVTVYSSRSVLMLAMLVVAWGMFFRGIPSRGKKILAALTLLLIGVVVDETFHISGMGRYQGKEYSILDVGHVLKEINPFHSERNTYSSGWSDRFEWWKGALQHISEGPQHALLGAGYGMPLIDFVASGGHYGNVGTNKDLVVREPHNDYLTLLIRSGLIGSGLFWLFQARIFLILLGGAGKPGLYRDFFRLALIYTVGMYMIMGGEPLLSHSYFMVPFYFVQGMGLAMSAQQVPRPSAPKIDSLKLKHDNI